MRGCRFDKNIKWFWIAAIILTSFLNFVGCSNNHFLRGLRLLGGAKDYDGAIAEFTKAIESNPKSEGAYWGRGTAYHIKGDDDRAIQDYNKAIELNPKSALAYSNRGNTFYCQGKFREAIPDYLKAIANNYKPKDYPYLRLLLASRRVSKEDYERYKKEFGNDVAPQKIDEWIREISIYYLGGPKTELHIINHAQQPGKNEKEIKGRLCEAYYYLGEYRLMKGDRQGAEEFFRKSIETGIRYFSEHHSSQAMLKLMADGKL